MEKIGTLKEVLEEVLRECGELEFGVKELKEDFERMCVTFGSILDEMQDLGYLKFHVIVKDNNPKSVVLTFKLEEVSNLDKCLEYINQ